MNTKIQDAAKRLLDSGSISNEECGELCKMAGADPGMLSRVFGALASGAKATASGAQAATGVGEKILQTTAVLTGLGVVGLGAKKFLVDPFVQQAQLARSYSDLTTKVPSLQGKDPQQIADYFDVVRSYSPRAASNPLVAGALVNKMIEFGGVDHKLVKDIADIQGDETLFSALSDLSGGLKAEKKEKATPFREEEPRKSWRPMGVV